MRAIAAGYGVLCALADAAVTWDRGWDSGFTIVAAAVAAGMLLDLSGGADGERGIAGDRPSPRIPLRQIRAGAISHWKGAASADATSHAIRAAYLASAGMTGPDAPFEGRYGGVMAQVTGPFCAISIDPARDYPSETDIKLFSRSDTSPTARSN